MTSLVPVATRCLVLGVAMSLLVTPVRAAEVSTPMPLGSGDARQLLDAADAALRQAHVGRVSVVTFSAAGPRVADLDVRVDPMGGTELRRPTRWLVGAPGGGWLRTADGSRSVTPLAPGARLDVDAVLTHFEARVGPPRGLDTGPATPVHLQRRAGTAIEEVLYIDHATSLPVRRETRDAEGAVLRVVAYTSLARVDLGSGATVVTPASAERPPGRVLLDELAEHGYDVPAALGGSFDLLEVEHADGMAVARYGDGLSVLSVYQQQGGLDPAELRGATVRELADRSVWTWPGSEPLRVVWTGGERTFTLVSDAPLPVVTDALSTLPGEQIGHDVPSRVARGLSRIGSWLRGLLPG